MISKSETVSDIAKDFERESKIHRMCKSGSMSMWQATKYALRFQAAHEREVKALRERLKVAEEICEHEIACRQKIQARCEMCLEDSSAGEDCPYHGEPCGCNSPTYGDFPTEKEYAPFVKILSEIRKEGRVK